MREKTFNANEFLAELDALDNNDNYQKFAHATQPNSGDSFAQISEEGLKSLESNIDRLIAHCES